MQAPTIAVILSGCGALDGSEIHEATLTLLALDRAGLHYQCLAPNILQSRVTNMLNKKEITDAPRQVLEESARIARGNIKAIASAKPADYAAVIFPGGFGAALNLCSFGLDKTDYSIQSDVLKFTRAMIEAKKPAGFICIAPVIAAKLYPVGVRLTIGDDKDTVALLTNMGVQHVNCIATHCVVDEKYNVVSTPAYMVAHSIKEVATGIECLVKELQGLLAR